MYKLDGNADGKRREFRPAPAFGANRKMFADVAEHAHEEVGKISDPKTQALFETTAEVLSGLEKAFEHYENRAEKARQ